MPKRKLTWQRHEVDLCYCYLSSVQPHKHCPCLNCEGAPVHEKTERKHRKQFFERFGEELSEDEVGSGENSSSDTSNYDSNEDNRQSMQQTDTEEEQNFDSDDNSQNSGGQSDDNNLDLSDNNIGDGVGERDVDEANELNQLNVDIVVNNNRGQVLVENLLQTLTLASDMNASISMTEKLLVYVGSLVNKFSDVGDDWPKTFAKATSILKTTGLYS
eukprot:TCONS_00034372-protein